MKFITLPIIIGTGALILLTISMNNLWLAKQSLSWPSVRGRILEASVSPSVSTKSYGNVTIRYEYSVQNRVYQGDRFAYSQAYKKDFGDTSRLQTRFVTGAEMNVYFDPDKPSNSVLIPGYEPRIDEFSGSISGLFLLTLSAYTHFRIRKGT